MTIQSRHNQLTTVQFCFENCPNFSNSKVFLVFLLVSSVWSVLMTNNDGVKVLKGVGPGPLVWNFQPTR